MFADIDAYADYLRLLHDTGTIFRPNQAWWGVRPHPTHGTVELRMFDAQPDMHDTAALAALGMGVVAHACQLYDAGEVPQIYPAHYVDENLWRATRYGTEASFIDFDRRTVVSAEEAIGGLIALARKAGARADLGLDWGLDRAERLLSEGSSAVWQREMAAAGDLVVANDRVIELTMAGYPAPH
jgi:carboxylate-amine ligase